MKTETPNTLPACMAPDGGDPCSGYQELNTLYASIAAKHAAALEAAYREGWHDGHGVGFTEGRHPLGRSTSDADRDWADSRTRDSIGDVL
tara:strand:+ start:22833 stop:23102 length:270 start_codon:yes stop_codon:yes gene_type:complete